MTGQTSEEKASDSKDGRKDEQGSEADQSERAKQPHKVYEIDIFRDWCKACGICAAFCPRHCIKLDENNSPIVDQAEQCSGCGWCEVHCPDFAISVRQVKKSNAQREEDDIC